MNTINNEIDTYPQKYDLLKLFQEEIENITSC